VAAAEVVVATEEVAAAEAQGIMEYVMTALAEVVVATLAEAVVDLAELIVTMTEVDSWNAGKNKYEYISI
jgi:hypothetical protein